MDTGICIFLSYYIFFQVSGFFTQFDSVIIIFIVVLLGEFTQQDFYFSSFS